MIREVAVLSDIRVRHSPEEYVREGVWGLNVREKGEQWRRVNEQRKIRGVYLQRESSPAEFDGFGGWTFFTRLFFFSLSFFV